MMFVNRARNVCEALSNTIDHLLEYGTEEYSRAGRVIVAPYPIMTITKFPRERVLFSAARDANPFFHIAEAMWMLAGEFDGKFLDRFVGDFTTKYAEKDGTIHDAYGFRWRRAMGYDQLDQIVDRLLLNQSDRQCVIQMWDATGNFEDLRGEWKGRPCNTHCYVRINDHKLDLTVCCRSNDMLWGAHGSNAVHFSILQEYLAARIDVGIGVMYQLSNNAHIYTEVFDKIIEDLKDNRYSTDNILPTAMFEEPECIDRDVQLFMKNMEIDTLQNNEFVNSWFFNTLSMMMLAHKLFKQKKIDKAIDAAYSIEAQDWRQASCEWLERRIV